MIGTDSFNWIFAFAAGLLLSASSFIGIIYLRKRNDPIQKYPAKIYVGLSPPFLQIVHGICYLLPLLSMAFFFFLISMHTREFLFPSIWVLLGTISALAGIKARKDAITLKYRSTNVKGWIELRFKKYSWEKRFFWSQLFIAMMLFILLRFQS